MDLILENWAELILALMVLGKVIVNITPTEKDNKVFAYVDDFINYFIKDKRND
jgi:hypothetical protein|tara:strand:+ start:62 stop:220 length:159 start_codon:yes stop_codon:yes gene_type:complete